VRTDQLYRVTWITWRSQFRSKHRF